MTLQRDLIVYGKGLRAHEQGARMRLWRDGRLVECDGAVCFAIGGDAKEASESKNPAAA